MKLFKYSSIDKNLLQNLQKNQIYFNVVNRVNDPYEGIIDFKVQQEIKEDFIRYFYRDNYDKEKFSKYTFDQIKRNIIFQNVNTFLKDCGMSCFSEINNSLVMWGHYASNHSGVCIEYDSTIGVFENAVKVEYPPNIHTVIINSKSRLNEEYLIKACEKSLYKKCVQWKYEKEWRIIFLPDAVFEYPIDAIKAIFFGLRTTKENIEFVYRCTRHIPGLNYYQATLKPHEYKIVFNPLKFNKDYKFDNNINF